MYNGGLILGVFYHLCVHCSILSPIRGHLHNNVSATIRLLRTGCYRYLVVQITDFVIESSWRLLQVLLEEGKQVGGCSKKKSL